jgi:Mitochondrial degradasome RNA helicase subunit C terminal
MDAWTAWVKGIRANILLKIPPGHYFPALESTTSDELLKQAEARVKLLSAYRWMHYRFGEVFPDVEAATSESAQINQFIANSLKEKIVRQCNRCAKPLPKGHQPGICDRCRRNSSHHHFHGRN